MNNETFFGKIIVNALEAWVGSFGDEGILRSIIDNNNFMHGLWTDKANQRKEKALEDESKDLGFKMSYVSLAKVFSRQDVQEMIKEIRTSLPLINNPFEVSSSTKTLGGMLDLSEAEQIILEAAARLYEGVDYDLYRTLQRIGEMEKLKEKDVFLSTVYGITKTEATDALDGFLIKSGLINETRGPTGFFNINSDIAPAFTIADMTLDKVEKVLFPSSIETDLTVEDYPHIAKEIERSRNAVEQALTNKTTGMNILLWGEPGTGKSELALAMAKKYGWNLKLVGDISSTDTTEKSRTARLASLKLGTKILARDDRAVILFDEIEDLFKVDTNAAFSKAFINRIIETTPVPIIWTTNSLFAVGNAVLRRMVFNINLEVPPSDTREKMWRKYSDQYKLGIDEGTITSLSETYDIAPALIHNAVKVAHAALGADERNDSVAINEIISSLDRLVNYGTKRNFEKKRVEEDTYDPTCSNTDRNLDDFTNRLLKAKPNFSLLLYGASGTGKSEYAKYLARRMGKKVLFKKASDILDKYVGGTEEKMAEAFAEAKRTGKFLIIDEGDSFLYNRERATHSWEITATNQMLTEMENHDQPFALTTNLKDDLDPAAMRRFTFKLKFDYITPDQAVKLFKGFFGYDAPQDIRRLDMLTPGDYANVKRQVDALEISDVSEIFRLIQEEVKQKPGGRGRLGF